MLALFTGPAGKIKENIENTSEYNASCLGIKIIISVTLLRDNIFI